MTDLALIGPYAWLIPAFTALAFLIIMGQIWTGRGNRSSAAIAIAGIAASAVLGVLVFLGVLRAPEELAHHPEVFSTLPWLPMGDGSLDFGIMIDPLSAAVTAMVGVVCLMIFIYASSYMEGELKAYTDPATGAVDEAVGLQRYARFFAYVSLFATGMLGFVLSSNLLQALVFWEIMGLCSFLLIGFWYAKPSAAAAAKKAFMTTRIGDMGFFIGIMALYWAFGSVDYSAMLGAEGVERMASLGNLPGTTIPLATLFALLLFGGSVGKSAQFPLHVWLPDAMEGPTPVSAMIHAATMVSAGVFLIARLFPVYASLSPIDHPSDISGAMFVVAAIGAFTALFAASIAVAQFDIKRVLAYSTISQLGYMVMALGIGAYVAAVFHLLTHAFFKALLFLGSGSVIHGVEHGFHHDHDHGHDADHADDHADAGPMALDPHDPQDMRNMGGLSSRMPLTYATFMAGTLALTGIPVFAGFWSKDEILASAFYKAFYEGETGTVVVLMPLLVWLLGTLAAFMTAFYMARQIFMVFSGKPSSSGAEHAPESAPRMVWPLAFLAVFAVFLGLVGVPEDFSILGFQLGQLLGGNPFHHFMGTLPTGSHFAAHPFNAIPAALSIGAAFWGWVMGYMLYGMEPEKSRAKDPMARLGGLWRLLNGKYYVDELYDATAIRGAVGFAGLNSLFDRYVVDGIVNGVSMVGERTARANGWVDRVLVDGTVNLIAYVNNEMSRWLKHLQSGRVQQYLLVVFLGLLALLMPLVL